MEQWINRLPALQTWYRLLERASGFGRVAHGGCPLAHLGADGRTGQRPADPLTVKYHCHLKEEGAGPGVALTSMIGSDASNPPTALKSRARQNMTCQAPIHGLPLCLSAFEREGGSTKPDLQRAPGSRARRKLDAAEWLRTKSGNEKKRRGTQLPAACCPSSLTTTFRQFWKLMPQRIRSPRLAIATNPPQTVAGADRVLRSRATCASLLHVNRQQAETGEEWGLRSPDRREPTCPHARSRGCSPQRLLSPLPQQRPHSSASLGQVETIQRSPLPSLPSSPSRPYCPRQPQ